jgi:hypothetical protein
VTHQAPCLPVALREPTVIRAQFITAQHYAAYIGGTPLPRHIPGRKRIDRELRELVYRDKGRRCAECGRTDYLTVDHIIPVALGGATNCANSRVLCEPHNRAAWLRFAPYMRAVRAYLKVAA